MLCFSGLVKERPNGEFPVRPLTHHILVGIRTNVDGIWWSGYCMCQPTYNYFNRLMFISVNRLLLFQVFSGHMEVQWPKVAAIRILVGHENVVGWLLFFMYMRILSTLLSRIQWVSGLYGKLMKVNKISRSLKVWAPKNMPLWKQHVLYFILKVSRSECDGAFSKSKLQATTLDIAFSVTISICLAQYKL